MRAHKTVRALDDSPDTFLAAVYDAEQGVYFAPYNPNVRTSQEGLTGEGVVVAVLDTGMLSHHPLLSGRIIGEVDFTGEGADDLNGHGTVVALVLLMGAPKTSLLNVKVLDRDKFGFEEDIVQGLRWAADHGATLINLSLGIPGPCDESSALCRETRKLADSGIVIVAAAGNERGVVSCPAGCKESVIAVGATDYSGLRVAEYSAVAEFYAIGAFTRVPAGDRPLV